MLNNAPPSWLAADPGCRLMEFDFCVAPEARILRTDLTWVRADAVALDDELIAFDEIPKGHDHSFRASRVLGVRHIKRPRVRVTTTHGTTVVATEHPFLARQHKAERRWVKARDLRPGVQLAFLAEPWDVDESRDAGYLAGFFDGEGWIGRVNVGFGQNEGPTLERVLGLLRARNFEFYQSVCRTNAHCEITNGIRPTLRFLGMIRPPRLMAKARQIWEGRRTWGKQSPICRVLSVEPLDDGPVVAIETTTKTYISDGFFSHNSGIEAVLTGWFSGDPNYIRLAKLGVHAYLTAHVGKDADAARCLTWNDDDLAAYLGGIKKRFNADNDAGNPNLYDPCKTAVHGRNYRRTAHGLARDLPQLFPTVASAQHVLDIYDAVCPKLEPWQRLTLDTADQRKYLGGGEAAQITLRSGQRTQAHPFGYTHWFWGVKSYRPVNDVQLGRYRWQRGQGQRPPDVIMLHGRPFKVVLGDDAKRAVAFFPQSTAAGVLFEVLLALFAIGSPDYIGDAFYGRTPLRAPIHDSLLLEVPRRIDDRVIERVARVMRRPLAQLPIPEAWRAEVPSLGEYLSIGVEAKAGPVGGSWGEMRKLALPALDASAQPLARVDPFGLVADTWTWTPAEDQWEEDVADLSREVSLAGSFAGAGRAVGGTADHRRAASA